MIVNEDSPLNKAMNFSNPQSISFFFHLRIHYWMKLNSRELHYVKIRQLLRLREFTCENSKSNLTCRRNVLHYGTIKQLLRLHEFICADIQSNVTCRCGNDTVELLKLHCIGFRALHFVAPVEIRILLLERNCIATGAILRVSLYYISDIVQIAIHSAHIKFRKVNISVALS